MTPTYKTQESFLLVAQTASSSSSSSIALCRRRDANIVTKLGDVFQCYLVGNWIDLAKHVEEDNMNEWTIERNETQFSSFLQFFKRRPVRNFHMGERVFRDHSMPAVRCC